jgi:ABC-type histidine transport system ATPase subunit
MADSMIFEAIDIHKRFGSHEVLKGVSVAARKGDVISMIGSSGSGKSTFPLPQSAGATQRRPHHP